MKIEIKRSKTAYDLGDVFESKHGDVYVLAQYSTNAIHFVSIFTGNRCTEVQVDNLHRVSPDEIAYMIYCLDLKYIGRFSKESVQNAAK